MSASRVLSRVLLPALLAAGAWPAPLAAQGRLAQRLEAFYSPSAALFGSDGRTLFVANAARGQTGMLAGRGGVSRVRVTDSGTLEVEQARFITGLNAPMALAWLGTGSRKFPAGTLVVAMGGSWTVGLDGQPLAEARDRGTGLALFDPASGKELGRIFLGHGSPVEKPLGHAVIDPSALAADPAGNVYLADVTGFNIRPVPAEDIHPGIVKLTPAALDALADDQEPPPGSVQFAGVPQLPTGLAYSVREDALYWTTGGGDGPLGGALFSVPGGDLSGGARVTTVAKELNSIAAVVETPRGSMILARSEGDLMFVRGEGRAHAIRFRERISFLSPGQMGVATAADGRLLLALPELVGGGIGPWRQRVQVITLPGDF